MSANVNLDMDKDIGGETRNVMLKQNTHSEEVLC